MSNKKSIIRKIPGFRSGTPWKMMLAYIGYSLIIVFILAAVFLPDAKPDTSPITFLSSSPLQNTTIPTTIITSIQTTVTIPIPTTPTSVTTESNYIQGSKIQKSTDDPTYDPNTAWIILRINSDGTYTIGRIYYDRIEQKWWKSDEELPDIKTMSVIKRAYPNVIGQVNWDYIPTKYTYKDCDGIIKYSWTPQSNCPSGSSSYQYPSYSGSSVSSSSSGSSDSSKQCWVNDYYRKDGTFVSGYWRRCPS